MIPTMRRRIPQTLALLKASLLKSTTLALPYQTALALQYQATLALTDQIVALLKGTASAVPKSILPNFGALAPAEAPNAG